MELKDLYPVTLLLVMVGMLLGVGVLTFSLFGDAVKESTGVLDETIAIAAGSGVTANDEILSVANFANATAPIVVGDADFNFTDTVVLVNTSIGDGDYIINYTYASDSATTDVMDDTTSAISAISTTWLPLIVTVFILAIIMSLVIRSFAGKSR